MLRRTKLQFDRYATLASSWAFLFLSEPKQGEGHAELPGFWGDIIRTINWTALINVVQFFVLMWLLKWIIFDPVIKIVSDRQNKIGLNLASAEQQRKEVQALKEKREHELAAVGAQARQIVEEARRTGDKLTQQSYQTARTQGQQIIEKAKKEAEAERAQLRKTLESELVSFAGLMAAKLLGREVQPK
jgi:F-type H+-transporting ATPase subunit b